MDEIKETQKNSPQSPGKASEGSEETTPKADAKTYTEKDVEKAVQVALTKAGRDDKTLTDKEATLNAQQESINARQAEIDDAERQRDAAELAAAKGDPELLKVYQDKQVQKREVAGITAQKADLKKEREALDRSKAEHEAENKAARETQLEIEIWKIAEAEGVDPVELKDTMKDLNLTTVEQAKSVAKRLNKKPEDGTTEKKKAPDSLVTSGGKGSSEGKTSRQIYADNFRDENKK